MCLFSRQYKGRLYEILQHITILCIGIDRYINKKVVIHHASVSAKLLLQQLSYKLSLQILQWSLPLICLQPGDETKSTHQLLLEQTSRKNTLSSVR